MTIPHLRYLAAFSLIGTISLLPLLTLPAMIGLLVDDAGMSDSSAGWLVSANFFASAIASLIVALRVHHLNLRHTTMLALVIAIVADSLSAAAAGETVVFFVARVVAGLGLGVSYAASVSSMARYEGYERGFGLFVTFQFLVSGLALYVLPVYAEQIGAGGLFFCFAVFDCIAMIFVRFLPLEKATAANASATASEIKALVKLGTLVAIFGFAIFEAAASAQFSYIERFGVSLQISNQEIGFSLLIASFLGIPGAFSIFVMGTRFGTLAPLAFGVSIAIVGMIILLNAVDNDAYFIGSCCMGFSWAFSLPFIQSLLASMDRKGSVIAAGTSLSVFGAAVGPAMGALVVANQRYESVFILAITLFTLSLLAFLYIGYHGDLKDEEYDRQQT